ncbi:hypothetical protein QWT36_23605, partial [Salmonella enterica subsp. enterica serovar Typhi]|nr:hypothetical protein [Salmonella enterica subsp. enterica serovar Typhi]
LTRWLASSIFIRRVSLRLHAFFFLVAPGGAALQRASNFVRWAYFKFASGHEPFESIPSSEG